MHYPLRSARLAIVLFVLACAEAFPLDAAERSSSYQAALESIKADELAGCVNMLASDAMEGREAGTPGGRAAADYLAKKYAGLHLQGGAADGAFLQPFKPNFRNVLAILRGSDPKWRDQVIVIGAHYDHLGYGGPASLGPYGYIHPGADDNASGTATVLELAKAFTVLASPPKRTILFAAWDGEEKGLLGSKHWLAQPTVPLDHVVAAINLDMVGRLRDDHLMLYGVRTGCGWRRLLSSQNDGGLRLEFTWTMKPNADHYPFFDHGIPVLMFHTGMHDDYHRPADVASRINSAGMSRVGRLLFAMVYEMAEQPAAVPNFRAAARWESPEAEAAILAQTTKPGDRLGVLWTEDATAADGVHVSGVTPGSPADRAGVRADDHILRFADRVLRSDDDFFAAVSAAESPATASIRRPSEKRPIELQVRLSGSQLRWGMLWRVDEAEPGVVILSHVVPGSPAALAGLRPGDRIYQVGGRDFADETAFAQWVKNRTDSLQLLVERDGRLRTMLLQVPQAEPLKRAA